MFNHRFLPPPTLMNTLLMGNDVSQNHYQSTTSLSFFCF